MELQIDRSRLYTTLHAGSENQKTSGAMGEQFKESIKINKSLSTLGLVISRLAHAAKGPAEHVPYRDSRLTWLLKVHFT